MNDESSKPAARTGNPAQCEALGPREVLTTGLCKSDFTHIFISLTKVPHKSLPLVPG